MNKYSMQSLANQILAVSERHDLFVSPLLLQMTMYFTMKRALQHRLLSLPVLQKMYDQPFLAWGQGPIIESIYDKYEIYGNDPIFSHNLQPAPNYQKLNGAIQCLLYKDPLKLSAKAKQEPFWKNHQSQIKQWRSNVKYSLINIELGK